MKCLNMQKNSFYFTVKMEMQMWMHNLTYKVKQRKQGGEKRQSFHSRLTVFHTLLPYWIEGIYT